MTRLFAIGLLLATGTAVAQDAPPPPRQSPYRPTRFARTSISWPTIC